MFSLVVQMEVRPGRREQFLAGMSANAEASVRDEPGCLRFDVCSVADDPHLPSHPVRPPPSQSWPSSTTDTTTP